MNLTNDFTSKTIPLNPDYEGEVIAVLTSSNFNTGQRKSVLYLHGYKDYFFQAHLGKNFNTNNFDFYALDLRKCGRALLDHQHPNYCKAIEEYFEEITIAIREIKSSSSSLFILAHSAGGLIASNYMNNGIEKKLIDGLILNSPFFDFNQSKFTKAYSLLLAKLFSNFSNYANIKGALPPVYSESIHKDFNGEWDFNLDWKPITGFPTYFKWVVAISNAQKKLDKSNITVPILVIHSSGSLKLTRHSKEAMSNDLVLNIEDIKRVGKKLGKGVTFLKIHNAQHDIFLSGKAVREVAFEKMFSWLSNTDFEQ